MAITRVWQSGFEHNEFSKTDYPYEFDSVITENVFCTLSPVADGIGGSYALKSTSNGADVAAGFVHTGNLLQFRVGCHFKMSAGVQPDCSVLATKTLAGTILYQLVANQLTNQLKLYSGGVYFGGSATLTPGVWHHLALDVLHSATVGWADLWLDGNFVYSFGLGNTGAVAVQAIGLGSWPKVAYVAAIADGRYDNWYIDNMAGEARGQAPPIYYYKALLPNADGNYSNWVGSDGNRTNNYLLVDEVPPNEDTDYVFASGTAIKDSYGVGAYTPQVGTLISSIIPTAIARKTGPENVLLGLGTRLGGVDVINTGTSVPATSYSSKFFFERQTTKPGGGVWESADVEDVEIIIESGGTYA